MRMQVVKLLPTKERLESVKTSIEVQIYSRKELLEDLKDLMATMRLVCKRPSNTPVSGIVFVMNSGHERGCWSVGWSS